MSNKESSDQAYARGESKRDSIVCKDMCYFCFDVLDSYLNRNPPPKNPHFTNEPFPIFVTWSVGNNKKLRGCIGTFKALNLHDGLRDYALKSALRDDRFSPIKREELNDLNVDVSILTNFEEAKDYTDWELGVNGIRIEFYCPGHSEPVSATYLPEVAQSAGWNRLETIDALLRKGGFRGNITPQLRESIKLTRYRSEKLSVDYNDYLGWRDQLTASA